MSLSDFKELVKATAEAVENPHENKSVAKRMADSISKRMAGDGTSLTQYAQAGKKLFPTTDTIKKLPTGCYSIGMTPNGNVYFEEQRLYTDKILRLPDSKSDEVIKEIDKFWNLKQKYSEYGLSFKRGFLLHGPPGSGKTCTVNLIVEQMVERGGIVVFGANPVWVGAALSGMREVEPDRPLVVVLEDLDSIVAHYGEPNLLSLLDGEMQIDNVVFIATTNYPEKLDQRIINRPSRFDKIVKIDVPNADARTVYLKSRLNDTTSVTDSEGTHDLVPITQGFSIAHLRELIVSTQVFGNTVKETVERLKGMKITPKSSGGNPMGIVITEEDLE